MTETQLIERIVAEVMSRLVTEVPNAPATIARNPVHADRLFLAQPVLTESLLNELVADQKTVEIGPRTILTPAARDWLRHRSIEVVRGTGTNTSPQANVSWILLVDSETESARLVIEHLGWDFENVKSVTEAATRATAAIAEKAHHGSVVLTSQPEVVACLANRNEMTRAAVVGDVTATRRIKESLEPNLFAIDPGGRSFFELRNLLRSIAQA